MVEGVAQSVNQFVDQLDALENDRPPAARQERNVITPPSRLNALRWLWEAPGNS